MFVVKVHQGPHGNILVITDKEILDKKFEDDKLQLDLTKDYYKGEEKTEEEIKEMIKKYYILHLTGPATIDLFVKEGIVEKENVLFISGIPHAEVYVVET